MPLSHQVTISKPWSLASWFNSSPIDPSSTAQAAGRPSNRKGSPRAPASGTYWARGPWLFAVISMMPALTEVSISASSPRTADGVTLTVKDPPEYCSTNSANSTAAS